MYALSLRKVIKTHFCFDQREIRKCLYFHYQSSPSFFFIQLILENHQLKGLERFSLTIHLTYSTPLAFSLQHPRQVANT